MDASIALADGFAAIVVAVSVAVGIAAPRVSTRLAALGATAGDGNNCRQHQRRWRR